MSDHSFVSVYRVYSVSINNISSGYVKCGILLYRKETVYD
jgi:hypothetical protein